MRRSFIAGLLGFLGLDKATAEQTHVPVPSITTLTPLRLPADTDARDWFWRIIDASLDADEAAQITRLRGALDTMVDQDLVDFIGLYWGMHSELYMWRLWAAAYLMNGGCSDDGFIDFRAWLIARGRVVTERAVTDPDSLADLGVEMDSASFEQFGYVMLDAFRARSGGVYPAFRSATGPHEPVEPDCHFDFDDEGQMRQRLPRLSALYL